jgi:hypothetical protein
MRILPLCLLTAGLSAWPGSVAADPIRLLFDERSVSVVVGARDDFGHERADDQVRLREDNLSASAIVSVPQGHSASAVSTLTSSLADLRHLSGVSAITMTMAVPSSSVFVNSQTGANAASVFEPIFQLDTPHEFDFSVRFAGTENHNVLGPNFSAINNFFGLFSHVDTHPHMVIARAVEFGEFREKGLIAPGEYRLAVEMLAATGNNVPGSIVRTHGEFAFRFDLTPVSAQTPEPASLVLLGSGLLALVRIPRSRPVWTGPSTRSLLYSSWSIDAAPGSVRQL